VTIPEWGADRPLDEGIVRRALAEALPDLKPSTVEPIGSGWDFDTWALGLQRVARFPRRAEVVETTLREARFMPKATAALRPLDIATPEVRALAEPTEAFPYPFLIQRRLWGLPLQALKPGRFSPRLARHLGRCIRAIHDLDCEDGLLEDSTDYADAEIEHALELTDRLDEALADRIAGPLEWLRTGPVGPPSYEGPLAVIHNDLSPEHVRIARTGLAKSYIVADVERQAGADNELAVDIQIVADAPDGRSGAELDLATVTVKGHVLTEEGGVEAREVKLPITLTVGTEPRMEPRIEKVHVLLEAAEAREEAIRRADRGDYGGAAEALREKANRYGDAAMEDEEIATEIEELRTMADQMEGREFSPADRKYFAQMSYDTSRSRSGSSERIRRDTDDYSSGV